MQPVISILPERKLVGFRKTMSLTNNQTPGLWQHFMRHREEIKNAVGDDLFSVQTYRPDYFLNFDPAREFEKWATAEVTDFDAIPQGMETLMIPEGLYAVFHYKGSSARGAEVFGHIFGTWLPTSGYVLDNRPHFEILGEKYKNNSEDSEEDICIPIKPKP